MEIRGKLQGEQGRKDGKNAPPIFSCVAICILETVLNSTAPSHCILYVQIRARHTSFHNNKLENV